ncbi:MAG: sugar ABC transporter substrate-binding protein [Anaerolineae bacterium]|uniref:ABC transporter substrate-binding protein n=1 Tax=Candidatus Flexifilum breve TaxID=3140694 RepID=UPI001AD31637|nr:sugar ABC transporter substrate-binding protein [Chloroflexota bacterium]MBK9745567.1 sugar ABC transporter substrate-binding protein [Chloroflexota bacterium]MBN8634000.1 sugar ABC transporter substrate-binding protein [Anaerolineae bacterium]
MKRRSLLVVVLLALLAISIAPLAAQDGVTLTMWSRDSNQDFLRELVDMWNGSHANQIELTIIPAADFVTRVGVASAGGEAPDLLPIDLIYVPAFARAGNLTEIGDFIDSLPYADQLSPSHIHLGEYDGGRYAVPFAAEGSVLLYNKGLFEQAGLDPEAPPTTWQEIYDAAVAITALGDDIYGYYFSGACAGCNAFTYLPLIWASGGDVLSEDGLSATVDSPEVRAALEFYQRMWNEGLIPPSAQADTGTDFLNAFLTGKIGMAGSGAFSISVLKNDHPEIDFGLTFLPGQDGGTSSFAGGDSIAITSSSQHAAEAFEFIQWVLSEEIQLEMFAARGQLPLRADLIDNEYSQQDPRLITNAEAMNLGKTPYSFVYNQLFNDANGPWLSMIQTAIFQGDIDGAVATAQQGFTDILASE